MIEISSEEAHKKLDEFKKHYRKRVEKEISIFKVSPYFDEDIRDRLMTIYSDIKFLENLAIKHPKTPSNFPI